MSVNNKEIQCSIEHLNTFALYQSMQFYIRKRAESCGRWVTKYVKNVDNNKRI